LIGGQTTEAHTKHYKMLMESIENKNLKKNSWYVWHMILLKFMMFKKCTSEKVSFDFNNKNDCKYIILWF